MAPDQRARASRCHSDRRISLSSMPLRPARHGRIWRGRFLADGSHRRMVGSCRRGCAFYCCQLAGCHRWDFPDGNQQGHNFHTPAFWPVCGQCVYSLAEFIYASILAITNEMPFRRRGFTMTVSTRKLPCILHKAPCWPGLPFCLPLAADRTPSRRSVATGDKQKCHSGTHDRPNQ